MYIFHCYTFYLSLKSKITRTNVKTIQSDREEPYITIPALYGNFPANWELDPLELIMIGTSPRSSSLGSGTVINRMDYTRGAVSDYRGGIFKDCCLTSSGFLNIPSSGLRPTDYVKQSKTTSRSNYYLNGILNLILLFMSSMVPHRPGFLFLNGSLKYDHSFKPTKNSQS